MADGKRGTALVTGASSGIGEAIATRLAYGGCRVLLHYHSGSERATALRDRLPGDGHATLGADLGDPAAVQRLVADALGIAGSIDILVNNAGVYFEHALAEVDYAGWQHAWQRTLATNLLGPANLCYCAGTQMIAQRRGRIVNISSRGAFRGEPEAPAYGASKAGLNALGQSLARALAPHGVSVFTIAPGFVDTPMVSGMLSGELGAAICAQSPLGRVGRPEEIAALVEFLALGDTELLTGGIFDANGASYLRS